MTITDGLSIEGRVMAVAASPRHAFSKHVTGSIAIIAGDGVSGDAHAGRTVQHLSRVAANPDQPNLRQVHLLHSELFEELAAAGFALEAGQLGENILTAGIDLLTLPRGTLLELGNGEARAVLEVTGLRNPCRQIEAFRPGLLAQLGRRSTDGGIERLAGIMCTAITSGTVRAGDSIAVTRPEAPHHALEPV